MQDLIVQKNTVNFDELFSTSLNCLYVCFPKSPSKNYKIVLSMVGERFYYGSAENDGTVLTVARFDTTNPLQANIAMTILQMMKNWKGVMIVFNGKFLFSHLEIASILACQGVARSCDNHLAHCTSIKTIYLDDHYRGKTINVIFPCSYIYSYFHYQKEIQASIKEQIQALSAEKGVLVCPFFSMKNCKEERRGFFGKKYY